MISVFSRLSVLVLVCAGLGLVTATPAHAASVQVQVLAINDFHGRIKASGAEAGAAAIATYVKGARAANPNTVFAAAGDLIGASTFESYIADDQPTIDALNEAGLDVSSVGNHEFDRGYADLVDRVMGPGGAQWPYLGANLVEPQGADAIKSSWTRTIGAGTPDEITVGFIGAVTEHLPELVKPAGIAGLEVTDVVAAVNAEATRLRTDPAHPADAVLLLVHEGAPSTDCSTMAADPASDFGSIVTGVSADVDAIVSGHTHLAYDCDLPQPGGGTRPVVSAGRYGYNLNKLTFTVDPAAGAITSAGISHELVPLTVADADGDLAPIPESTPPDPATQAIVDAAVADAEERGAVVLGQLGSPYVRASRPTADGSGLEENRGGESTLGNLVAETQRWATRRPALGGTQIAFTNPGGVRADLLPGPVTYRDVANVQPFANPLVNLDLTGSQVEEVLEQQWQAPGANRPFIKLGVSRGFTYTYDPERREILSMWLFGHPVVADEVYSVTVNAYLASGGDNFTTFLESSRHRDVGVTDLEAAVDYVVARTADGSLLVDYRQHAVGVQAQEGRRLGRGSQFSAVASVVQGVRSQGAGANGIPVRISSDGNAASVRHGRRVAGHGIGSHTLVLRLSSLAFSGPTDTTDRRVVVTVAGRRLGAFPVDNTVAPGATDDEAGHARVVVRLPDDLGRGERLLRVRGLRTGTLVRVPVHLG